MKAYQATRTGWARHYARSFNRTGSQHALQLAMWYEALALAFDQTDEEKT
jgi:hypothetical protein